MGRLDRSALEEPLTDSSEVPLFARGLSKRYPRRDGYALSDVNLRLPSGRLIALVGPNGAGKTTLMRCWLGFERPTSGAVAVLGVDPWSSRRQSVVLLAHVPQEPSFYASLTVEDHLRYAAMLRPTFNVADARRVLDELGISRNVPARALSGGQRVQLGLAIAIASRARVMILDEPLAHLDPLARRDMLRLIAGRARSEGVSVLVSSHLVSDLEGVFHHIVVMGNGRVLLDDSTQSATESFVVVEAGDGGRESLDGIGRFVARDGTLLTLEPVATRPAGARSASLEDVVLGHLARARADAAVK